MDLFNKAKEAAEKYHVKEKAVEYAQKQVAMREEEQCRAEFVEKKDKTIVNKAVEAAEDFLAKQGQPNVSSPTDCERRSRSSSSSSSSSSDDNKCRQKTIDTATSYSTRVQGDGYSEKTKTVIVTEKKYTSRSVNDAGRDFNSMSYPNVGEDRRFAVSSEAVGENYSNDSSSGRAQSYQEYWSEKDNGESAEKYPRYTGAPQYGSDNVHQSSVETSTSYSSRVEGGNSYGSNTRRRGNVDTSYTSRGENDNGYSESTATVVVTEKKYTSSYSGDSSRGINSSYPDETCNSFSRMGLGNDNGPSSGLAYGSAGARGEQYFETESYPRYAGDSQYDSDSFRRNTSTSYSARAEDDNCFGMDNFGQSSTNTSTTSYSSRADSSNDTESSSSVEKHTSSYAGERNSSNPSESDRYGARRDGYPRSSTQYQSTEEYSSRSTDDYNGRDRNYSSYQSSESQSGGDEFNGGSSYRHQSLEEYSSRSGGGYSNNADRSYQTTEEYSSRSGGEYKNAGRNYSSYQNSEEHSSRSIGGNNNEGRGYPSYSSGATEARTGYEVESDYRARGIQDSGSYPDGPSGVGMPYENYGSSNNG